MYMELIDAKDALIKAHEIIIKEKEDNFNKVIEPINNAINKGHTHVRCSVSEYALTSETLKILRKKGYRIFYDKSHFGIHYFIIAWDDENRETEDHSIKELFKEINKEN